jgi:hypothetical protein
MERMKKQVINQYIIQKSAFEKCIEKLKKTTSISDKDEVAKEDSKEDSKEEDDISSCKSDISSC